MSFDGDRKGGSERGGANEIEETRTGNRVISSFSHSDSSLGPKYTLGGPHEGALLQRKAGQFWPAKFVLALAKIVCDLSSLLHTHCRFEFSIYRAPLFYSLFLFPHRPEILPLSLRQTLYLSSLPFSFFLCVPS